MIEIAKQTIDYFLKFKKEPDIKDLDIKDTSLLERTGNIFVTIYLNWEINGSSGNIKEIETSIASEVIKNTINAISKDPRFEPIKEEDKAKLKIRIDEIIDRKVLQEWEIKTLEPINKWVIAIDKNYETLSVILPNISPVLLNWEDFISALTTKLWIKKFEEKNYIVYSIDTEINKDF